MINKNDLVHYRHQTTQMVFKRTKKKNNSEEFDTIQQSGPGEVIYCLFRILFFTGISAIVVLCHFGNIVIFNVASIMIVDYEF